MSVLRTAARGVLLRACGALLSAGDCPDDAPGPLYAPLHCTFCGEVYEVDIAGLAVREPFAVLPGCGDERLALAARERR